MQQTNNQAALQLNNGQGDGIAVFGALGGGARNLAEVAHDARNMVTALGLYCELLEEPGVLSPSFRHYGSELKLLASASRRLVEKLMALNAPAPDTDRAAGTASRTWEEALQERMPANLTEPLHGTLISNLGFELETNRNLLAALAGPGVTLTLDMEGGNLPVRMSGEDLTRILVNLVRNAVEAMPTGGRMQISLRELPMGPAADPQLLLSMEDNGPGIAPDMLERVFEPGFTTRSRQAAGRSWQGDHLGLGLSITRSIVEAAGGRIQAASRDPAGTCFQIQLPVRTA
jgi:signal transduction histidine kinase